jgi:hypothetical protein
MVTKMIPGEEQRAALTSLLKPLDPQMLTLPTSILDLLPPRPPSMPRTQESFQVMPVRSSTRWLRFLLTPIPPSTRCITRSVHHPMK